MADVGHRPDWSDWQDGDFGPSCSCGFNGTPEECGASRIHAATTTAETRAIIEEFLP